MMNTSGRIAMAPALGEAAAPEMAMVLGIKEPGVRSRLRRAKEQLRQRMELSRPRRDDAQTPASLDEWARSIKNAFAELGDRTAAVQASPLLED